MNLKSIFSSNKGLHQSTNFIKEKNLQKIKFWEQRFFNEGGRQYWQNLYHKLYKYYLDIDGNYLKGKTVLDIGCGPYGAIGKLNAKLIFGLDPLVEEYDKRFHLNIDGVIYLNSASESIPMLSNYFDLIISRNALDHVDNMRQTIKEIWRVLKPDGEIRLSINYQTEPTPTEPVVLNDKIINDLFQKYFNYKILKKFPPDHDSLIGGICRFKYPHAIILLQGFKKI